MNALASILSRFLAQVASTRDPTAFQEWVRRQRLEPLFYGVEFDGITFNASFLDECRTAYFNMIGHARKFTIETERLNELLAAAGISAYAWRGVVHGNELYGDPALRYFADIDLMVDRRDKWKALAIMEASGYRIRNRLAPRWYLARYHLHWPLIRSDGMFPVDLHWSVDHPYRISADRSFDFKSPVDRILMALLHAEKESRLRYAVSENDLQEKLINAGPILPWFDAALMITAADATTHNAVQLRIEKTQDRRDYYRGLWVLRKYFGVSMPDMAIPVPDYYIASNWRNYLCQSRPAKWFAEKIGCRSDALLDWWDMPENPSESRLTMGLKKSFHALRLTIDSAACGLWILAYRMSGRSTSMSAG
ncbi:MAG TPA: nucleotidyltransferase family protein [Kiritimatiellia bacterium]|nr:nucleotidyltransferase family protein [Kiritimatiellia bacterium]